MNMLAGLMGSFVKKEQMTYDTIQETLENVAEELNCTYKDFFIMIRPIDENGNFILYVCKYDEKGNPEKVREITLKEVFSIEE